MERGARVIDALLAQRLEGAEVVVLEGPRGVGASTAAARAGGHVWRTATDDYARQFVDMGLKILLSEASPVVFDEWDATPQLLPRVREAIAAGQLGGALGTKVLLAASRTPREAEVRDTADGAVSWLRMRPLSLWESGHSTGDVSLAALFRGEPVEPAPTDLDAHQLFDLVVAGGWPAVQGMGEAKARRWLREHLMHLVRVDLPDQGVRRGEADLRRLMATLAAGVGSEQKLADVARGVVARGVIAGAGRGRGAVMPRTETVAEYLAALRRLLLLEDVPAWTPTLTSAAALRRSPRRFFTDPSIALAALGAGTEALRRDLALAARHVEALVVRDLRTYADLIDGELFHVRDNNGRTVDLVVVLPDGSWGGVAVRMNPAGADDATAQLKWLAAKMDTSVTSQRPASFLVVVTGSGTASTRPDGIHVVPIASLRP